MELEALKEMWTRHEEELMESTRLNHALMRKLLIKDSEKRINWLKLRSLAGLALPPLMLVFIAATIEFRMEAAVIAGLLIFGSFAVLTYYWAVRFHVLMERIQMDHPIVEVKKQINRARMYKLRNTRYGLYMAPFAVFGIFLSAGIPFLSAKMIPFYILMIIAFILGSYFRSRHGLAEELARTEKELNELGSG